MKKRKYIDKRNWKEYNNKLIKRGEFYINLVFLDTWLLETKEINKNKEGSPYLYPNSLIEFLGILHVKSFDYRALQGIVNALSSKFDNFPVISYSQICRRVNKINIKFTARGDNLIVGVDGSGMKVSNRGDWMRKKWKVKRGWIKVVVMGDSKGNVVDIRVGNEGLNEGKSSRGMLRKNRKKVKKLLGDGLHDCKDTFNLCDKLNVDPVIKIRKNASRKARGSRLRKNKVEEYFNLGHEKWVKKTDMV